MNVVTQLLHFSAGTSVPLQHLTTIDLLVNPTVTHDRLLDGHFYSADIARALCGLAMPNARLIFEYDAEFGTTEPICAECVGAVRR